MSPQSDLAASAYSQPVSGAGFLLEHDPTPPNQGGLSFLCAEPPALSITRPTKGTWSMLVGKVEHFRGMSAEACPRTLCREVDAAPEFVFITFVIYWVIGDKFESSQSQKLQEKLFARLGSE